MNDPQIPRIAFVLQAHAFAEPRAPRSAAYRRGVLAGLSARAGTVLACPFTPGTPEWDAYAAGCDEGANIWHREMAS